MIVGENRYAIIWRQFNTKMTGTHARERRVLFLYSLKGENNDMDYGMIGKIEKAKRYAQERSRFHLQTLSVTMDGENNPHQVRYEKGEWFCDCDFFQTRGRCSHTIALEIILEGMTEVEDVEVKIK
jgi:hypothetical protein